MRLRNACVMIGVTFALCALAGCNAFRGGSRITDVSQPVPHFKSDANTPHVAAQNNVALAEEYMKDGKYEIALARLQSAVKLDPSSPDAYTMLGYLYEKINRPEQAEANYAKSVKLAPDKGDYLNNYGQWLCRSGHPTEADPLFRKALADPFYKTPSIALGNAAACATKAGKPELAESYERQALALDPNNAYALKAMASIQYQHGNYMSARGFAERLLAVGKASPDTLELAAQIEDKLGNQDGARDYRNRLSTEFPQYTPGQH
jgi:type IV pilus assembly protein PilF